MRNRRRVGAALLVLALLSLAGWRLAASRGPAYRGTPVEPPRPAPSFELVDESGRPFGLADLRGRAVLLFFGYASCPDVCPTTLGELRQVREELGRRAERVQVVLVTVDPERDTPERLRRYLESFGPGFKGLTGDPGTLDGVYRDYGVHVERKPAPGSATGHVVAHSAYTYLIDPEGRLRLTYRYKTPPLDIAHDVQRILARG